MSSEVTIEILVGGVLTTGQGVLHVLDMDFVRNHPDVVAKAARDKGIEVDVGELLRLDEEYRSLLTAGNELRAQRNRITEKISGTREAEERNKYIAQARKLKSEIEQVDAKQAEVEPQIRELMLRLPGVPLPGVPVGHDSADNVLDHKVGEVPKFDFEPLDHLELARYWDWVDTTRAGTVAGSRSYYLKGDLVLLEHAIMRMALDYLADQGYQLMAPPVMAREHAMVGTGYFPGFEEETYTLERDDLYLVGTSEVPLVAYYHDEILDEQELPKRHAGISPCFRREVGSAGKDVYGLYRVHQFMKVEQVVICKNDAEQSARSHAELLSNSEHILQKLELPYRVMLMCTGDMGQGQVYKNDIEAWMPSRGDYGETHSCSSFHEFQARRSMIRYRDEDGRVRYAHTLNNTAVASPRILIPLLEVHQQPDRRVRIPKALQPYMGGREFIGGTE